MVWQFVLNLVVFIAAAFFLRPKPQTSPPSGLDELKVPTAEDGREIPVLFGTKDIQSANVVWYGDLKTAAVRKDGNTTGYQYRLGMHLALCHGPIDSIYRIEVDERVVWSGTNTGGSVSFNKPDLFGGRDREGGVEGTIDFAFGESDQVANTYLTSKLSDVPAYRGVVSAIFRQVYLGNSPYLKPWRFRAARILVKNGGEAQWNSSVAQIDFKPTAGGDQQSFLASVFLSSTDTTTDPQNVFNVREFNFADTAYPTWSQYFGQGVPYLYRWGRQNVELNTSIDYTQAAPVIVPINASNAYLLQAHDGYEWRSGVDTASPDLTEFRIEFLTSENQVVFVMEGYMEGTNIYGTSNLLRYGPDIDNLQNAAYPATVYKQTRGFIYFETGQIRWDGTDPSSLSGSPPSDFTFACDAHLVTKARISNVYVKANFRTASDTSDPDLLGTGYAFFLFREAGEPPAPTVASMNPVHVIRECLTDLDWGMGYAASDIDDASFTAAASTLYSEATGINLLWDRQITIEDFILEVLRHIDATLYLDRVTGKFVIKLIRDDYVIGNLVALDEDDIIEVESYNRPTISELTNSVTVSYWDEANYKDGTVTVQDQALIQQQGSVINTTIQYPGFCGSELGAIAALRDLKALSTPLGKISIKVNRAAAELNVGDPFTITWADLNIPETVFRVQEMSLGDNKENTITVNAIEDVFGQPSASVIAEQESEWVEPSNAPTILQNRKVQETPYWDLVQNFSAADLSFVAATDSYVQGVAAPASSDSSDLIIWSRIGTNEFVSHEQEVFSPTAQLTAAISKTDTSITFDNANDIDQVSVGSYAIIDDEYVSIVAIDALYNTATIGRGVLDTVPVAHADDTYIYFAEGFTVDDSTVYTSADTVDVRLTPITSQGQLSVQVADNDSVTILARQNLPYPPGNLRINSQSYPTNINSADDLTFTWAHRDRLTQTAALIPTTTGDIGPEAGVTYTVKLYDDQSTLFKTETGLSSTTFSYSNETELAENGEIFPAMTVEIISVRDGLESYQALNHTFNRINGGYGILYGQTYGQVV